MPRRVHGLRAGHGSLPTRVCLPDKDCPSKSESPVVSVGAPDPEGGVHRPHTTLLYPEVRTDSVVDGLGVPGPDPGARTGQDRGPPGKTDRGEGVSGATDVASTPSAAGRDTFHCGKRQVFCFGSYAVTGRGVSPTGRPVGLGPGKGVTVGTPGLGSETGGPFRSV